MAITADVVEVQLRADTDKYIRSVKTAETQGVTSLDRIEREALAAGTAFSTFGDQAQLGLARATQAGTAARSSFSGVAAQFQDIGVTAAAGMNPLIIALQQGTQLSAQLQVSAANGTGVFRSLATGIAGLINPISLATIAAIALGTAALQSIGSIIPRTESANEAIKRHREALEGIVRGYESAESALGEYFDQVERLPQFAVSEQLRSQFDELAVAAESLPTRLQDVVDYVDALANSATDTDREIARLIRQFQDGELTLEQLYGALGTAAEGMGVLESAAGALGLGAAKTTADLRALILQVTQFGDEYARFIALTQLELGTARTDPDLQNALDLQTYIGEQERINGLTSEQLELEREIARIKSAAGEFGITDERAKQLAEETLAAEQRRADIRKQLQEAGRGGDKAAMEYERERQAIEDLLESMGFQAALLGQTNREKAIAIALSKANTSATEEERNAIAQTAAFIYDTEQAIKTLNETSREWSDTIKDATRGFIDDLTAGKDAADAFGNVLKNIGSQLINFGLGSLFGSGSTPGLFNFGGFKANGGPVSAGSSYIVGERGPELFTPSSAGRITSNSDLGSGGGVTIQMSNDFRGVDAASVARIEAGLERLAANIVPTVRREIAVGPKKGRR